MRTPAEYTSAYGFEAGQRLERMGERGAAARGPVRAAQKGAAAGAGRSRQA